MRLPRRSREHGSTPSLKPLFIMVLIVIVGCGLGLLAVANETYILAIIAILIVLGGLGGGMLYGEKSAGQLAQGPEPGGGRRRRTRDDLTH